MTQLEWWRREIARRIAAGLCRDCKTPAASSRCPACIERQTRLTRERRAKKKRAGICVHCSVPAEFGGQSCIRHMELEAGYSKAYRQRKKTAQGK